MRWLEHQWSEAFFLAFFHASEPLIEWISQLLVKTQQLGRATDKAAVFAFICKLVLKKKKREREGKERKLIPVIWVDILKSNAGHCSAGMLGGLGAVGIGQRRTEQREASQQTAKPLFIPSPVSTSFFLLIFSPSSSSPPLFRSCVMADSSDPSGTRPWKCLMPPFVRILAAFSLALLQVLVG